MELVDMRDLGSRASRRWGSSPHARTSSEIPTTVPFPPYGENCTLVGLSSLPPATRCAGLAGGWIPGCARIVFVNTKQLKNFHHRSVSALRRKLRFGGNFFAFRRNSLRWARGVEKSILTAYPKLYDPTQSEQIVVSCSDWVGLFFACSPCVSRATGSLTSDVICHWPRTSSSKSEGKRIKAEIRTPADITKP